MTNPLYDIIQEMKLRGGSFVSSLATAMYHADPENLAKLLAAFPDVIERYDAFATKTNSLPNDFQ